MKLFMSMILSFTIVSAFSHDGGHGPALKDESRNGGKMSAIIDAKEVKLGTKAKLLYKGELVHKSKKLDVEVHIYDVDMSKLGKSMEAVLFEGRKSHKFSLALDESGKFYKGQRPKNKRVPFNIDVRVKKGDQTLFGAFDNLD